MLHLYRRHRVSCPHRTQAYRRCQCPIYVKGSLAGTYVRMAMDQTNWDAATRIVADWTEAGVVGQVIDARTKTVATVVQEFIDDAESRGLADETLKKYRNLLETRLLTWCQTNSYTMLQELDLTTVTKFRATWTNDNALTKSKTQERLRWFFEWCKKRKYVTENPAEGLTPIKVTDAPTMPFTVEQFMAIMAAVDHYRVHNRFGHDNRARVRAFIMLLRWTGLRIRDVVTLEWVKIHDNRVFLRTQKTGVPVFVPIPQSCVEAVERLPRAGRYIFWTGNGKPESQVSNWQRALRKVFRRAGVPDGHAHRFRDTFAVELLLKGVDIADVSILLGHSSVKITEKHYAPWVRARQIRLESAVQRTWQAEEPPAPTKRGKRGRRQTQESATPTQA